MWERCIVTCAAVERKLSCGVELLDEKLGQRNLVIGVQRLVALLPVKHKVVVSVRVWNNNTLNPSALTVFDRKRLLNIWPTCILFLKLHITICHRRQHGWMCGVFVYVQLSISSEQVCVSRGNRLRSMLHMAVTVTLQQHNGQMINTSFSDTSEDRSNWLYSVFLYLFTLTSHYIAFGLLSWGKHF